jgi:hypothetical protein
LHDTLFTAGDGGGSRSIHVFPYMLMCVVREPSVPERDRDGKLILSYPILSNVTQLRQIVIPALYSLGKNGKFLVLDRQATYCFYSFLSTIPPGAINVIQY